MEISSVKVLEKNETHAQVRARKDSEGLNEQASGKENIKQLSTLVDSGHDELTVTKCLGCGQAAICSTDHHIEKLVTSLIHVHFATYYARDINVEVLFHGSKGTWVRTELDYWQNWVANDVTLSCREEMNNTAGSRTQGYLLCCC